MRLQFQGAPRIRAAGIGRVVDVELIDFDPRQGGQPDAANAVLVFFPDALEVRRRVKSGTAQLADKLLFLLKLRIEHPRLHAIGAQGPHALIRRRVQPLIRAIVTQLLVSRHIEAGHFRFAFILTIRMRKPERIELRHRFDARDMQAKHPQRRLLKLAMQSPGHDEQTALRLFHDRVAERGQRLAEPRFPANDRPIMERGGGNVFELESFVAEFHIGKRADSARR